jgi:flavin-dependent dehydrogenase
VRVVPARGAIIEARIFVDASGRGAPAGRGIGSRRWLACDRQVALIARFSMPQGRGGGNELLLEAAEEGFWYSVPQPDASLVVVLVTDADLVPAGGRSTLPRRYLASLARTTHTRARTCGLESRGVAWWAVGDAAMAIDPLAGNGVARALRSACDVAKAIHRALEGGKGDATSDDEHRFAEYLDRRAEIYHREARWPDAPFWARRRCIAWENAAITLHPETRLRVANVPNARELAGVEAILPPRAIAAAFSALAEARPAHEAMARLREVAPLGDRRLLVGLQELLARGAIAVG